MIAGCGTEAQWDRIEYTARRSPLSATGPPAALAKVGYEPAATREPVDDDPQPHTATLGAVAHVGNAPDNGCIRAANPYFGL